MGTAPTGARPWNYHPMFVSLYRNNTGAGQFVEMAKVKNAAAMFAQACMDYALNGRSGAASGNRSIHADDGEAPCCVYPCKSPGAASEGLDHWIAISVTCDREWIAGFEDYALFHRLQAAGFPAAPVLEASRVLGDAHVAARGLYQPCALEDDFGVYRYPVPLYEMPACPGGIRRPPVALGQDNAYVYRELLEFSDQTYQRLIDDGHIATAFADEVP